MPIIRLAKPDDSETIVKILRDGLGERLLKYTIYGTHGMAAFVQAQITNYNFGITRYFVSEEAGEIVGFAEFRLLAKEIFLNNIYVATHGRGTGSGKALLHAGLVLAQERGLSRIGLDVFSDNTKALSWYEKLGFEVNDEFVWLEMELRSDFTVQNLKILNLPFAECIRRDFGFATLDIETPSGSCSVGMLNDHFYRVTAPDILKDQELLAYLKLLGPSKKMLYIGNVSTLPDIEENSYLKIANSLRMSTDIKNVIACIF